MGSTIGKRIIILSCCFLLAGGFINFQPKAEDSNKTIRLTSALDSIKNWEAGQETLMDPRIVKELDLDDYIFRSYGNSNGSVTLYIGYYFSSKKVGAAHDPLVCFPGQGWAVGERTKGKVTINTTLNESVSYSVMLAERHSQRELIVYWFQSYDETNADTFSQKVSLFWKRTTQTRGDNAFVRVSTTLGDRTVEEGMEVINKFIKAFYPVFMTYVRK